MVEAAATVGIAELVELGWHGIQATGLRQRHGLPQCAEMGGQVRHGRCPLTLIEGGERMGHRRARRHRRRIVEEVTDPFDAEALAHPGKIRSRLGGE